MGRHADGIGTAETAVTEKTAGSKYAEVVLEAAPVKRRFTYAVPESLRGMLRVGSKVEVPLGAANRRTWGYIVRFIDTPKFDPAKIKEIIPANTDWLKVPDELLSLAHWISDYYHAPLGIVIRMMIPAAVRKPDASPKYLRYVKKNATIKELRQACIDLRRRAPKQAKVLEVILKQRADQPLSELCQAADASAAAVKALVERKLLKTYEKQHHRNFLKQNVFIKIPHKKLNWDQRRVFNRLRRVIDDNKFHVSLLHGVTGSGKTELYLQLVDHGLRQGKSAIVLVPEISLTPQTIEHFKSRFSEDVAVLHHRLSEGERYDEWHRILSGKSRIVIGPRSAVFAPVKNLGIIVIDEEHDSSYKQHELQPRYHAREVALARARNENALVILGGATPSLESYYAAAWDNYHLDTLPVRIDNRPMAEVKIIDMRHQRSERNRFVVLSDPLLEAIDDRVKNGEQVILLLNRRGYAKLAMCRECGFVVKCKNCSVSMKYHRGENKLVCHLCGYTTALVGRCPACGSDAINYRGIGTERVEKMLYKILDDVRVLRMDFDTTRKKYAHDRILNDFRRCRADILLGTQMIAKGLDFPNVTLVGILDADVSLHLQDFRAAEQTFQLVTQVAGRAGRGELPGEVYIQTLNPDNPAIIAASQQDYIAFYRQEMKFREELAYPPFTRMVGIGISGKEESDVEQAAEITADIIRENLPASVELLGPVPAPIARMKGRYRWQLFLKSADASELAGVIKDNLPGIKLKSTIRLAIDVDPIDLL